MSDKESFISEKNIIIGLDASSKEEAILQMSQALEKNGDVKDADQFYRDVLQRESLTTTGIGNSIAIPHGKSDAVIHPSLIFAKNKQLLKWNSLDQKPVNIIFLMAVGKGDGGKEHLQMLAHLSGNLMNDDFVAAIKEAQSPKEVLAIFDKFEEEKDHE